MKYDILKSYHEYLLTRYSRETARTYYIRLDCLLKNQNLNNLVEKLDIKKVIDELSKIKYKNHFSQYKNAFLHFCEFKNINLSDSDLYKIELLHKNTRKKYRKLQLKDFKAIDNKIKHIKNKKLKLCFQVMLLTGLRVSELAQIKHSDCVITENDISFSFIGKGGKNENTYISKEYNINFFNSLKEHIESIEHDKKVFYSAIYLQQKAKENGFTCHDLRRAYAKIEYKKSKDKEKVKEKLRHTSIKNTNIYLKSKIKIE